MYPLVSLVYPDEFRFLLEEDHTTYWIIEVNMGNRMLKSYAIYINEEEEEGCIRAGRIVFDGHSFIPSGFSNYLGMDAIKRYLLHLLYLCHLFTPCGLSFVHFKSLNYFLLNLLSLASSL